MDMTTFKIRGKNIEVTPALNDYVKKKIGKVTKYFDENDIGEITVVLAVEKDRHIVEVTVPVRNLLIRGEESTMEMYTSIDLVIEKIERQIRKYKTKLSKRLRSGSFKTEMMSNTVTSADKPLEAEEAEVIKSKRFVVKPMDVQEAIMQMNLLNHDFFVYRDDKTEAVNVVYKRKDGKYGLIESATK